MARADGFDVMDVSTSVLHDPKFRQVHRRDPALVAPAFAAYMAATAESWKAGRRVSVEDAWPPILPYDAAVVEALKDVRLVDRSGQIPAKTWNGWFKPAFERRETTRDRWRRANEKRNQSSVNDSGGAAPSPTKQPRGSRADTGAIPSVPSVPSEQSVSQTRAQPPDPNGNEANDWHRAQRLAEDLTGVAFVLPAETSKLGTIVQQQLSHGFDDVERSWRAAADATGQANPTIGQIVLGADRMLNPVPTVSRRTVEAAERDALKRRFEDDAAARRRGQGVGSGVR